MVTIKSQKEIELMKEVCRIVAKTQEEISKNIRTRNKYIYIK